MILLLEVLAVLAVVFGVAVLLTGRSEGLSDEGGDYADTGIPRDRAMTAQDVVGLRFALAFRGYRMSEVDDALDRLAAELNARDEELARLRAERTEATVADSEEYVPSDATGDVAPGTPFAEPPPVPGGWTAPAVGPATAPYVPSDATGDVAPGTEVDVVAAPDAEEPLPDTPEFREPQGDPLPDPLTDPLTDPLPAGTPAQPPVLAAPDVPYDPWSVTPQSRYTEGPTYVEVEPGDDGDDTVEAVTEHHTGHAPPPAPAAGESGDEPRP